MLWIVGFMESLSWMSRGSCPKNPNEISLILRELFTFLLDVFGYKFFFLGFGSRCFPFSSPWYTQKDLYSFP